MDYKINTFYKERSKVPSSRYYFFYFNEENDSYLGILSYRNHSTKKWVFVADVFKELELVPLVKETDSLNSYDIDLVKGRRDAIKIIFEYYSR